eukprot:TRINITY_DN2763_c0_g1_i3.p1 TRINITY_DN2763_c0_g1~~TRINITY_DN2763_c0_g1_i3.p1  ORF type:complete len:422 (+),score=91.33 TRINITY_DN2763_c0_g1_i3:44-1309(+)
MSSLHWRFCQVFGDSTSVEDTHTADIISMIEYDSTGNYIAVGDRGGRVILFERNLQQNRTAEYQYYTEFQSHELEFDYLRSEEIEERINQICWLKPQPSSLLMLTCNDKTIKLWKVYENTIKEVVVDKNGNDLVIPKLVPVEKVTLATPKRSFINAHPWHINSLSLCSDENLFLSSDELNINIWDLNRSDETFLAVNIPLENVEECTEIVVKSRFHPTDCNTFAYGSSRGILRIADMRTNVNCDAPAQMFYSDNSVLQKKSNGIKDSLNSIADFRFSPNGRNIVVRDYLTLRVYDVRVEHQPVKSIAIHDHLRSKLFEVYDNNCIDDQFQLCISHDGGHYLSGSYSNTFHIFDSSGTTDTAIEASRTMANKKRRSSKPVRKSAKTDISYDKKILYNAWHPHEPTIAIGTLSNLYIYSAKSS